MARVLVVHKLLDTKGGGEAVCMHVLEALQDDHEVTLVTDSRVDLQELNRYYGTTVSDVTIRIRPLLRLGAGFTRVRLGKLGQSVSTRVVDSICDEYDLLISTDSTLPPHSCDSLLYVHYPGVGRRPGSQTTVPTVVRWVYAKLCGLVDPNDGTAENTHYVANSAWTARESERYLPCRPSVIYPPVKTTDLRSESWEDRTESIVTVGRLAPRKNLRNNVSIVSALRERGHDVDYYIVGPSTNWSFSPFSDSYAERVRAIANQHDYVHVLGEVDRSRLVTLLSSAKYGLHGMEEEHFGIAIAEYVASGMIPFVPDSGGQREVVGDDPALTYESRADAVERMDRVLAEPRLQHRIRDRLPDIEREFGRDRFHREIRRLAADLVEQGPE
jgi:glycosyltransferase involved in cell wall biosynthesis